MPVSVLYPMVPVSAMVPVFSAGIHRRYRESTIEKLTTILAGEGPNQHPTFLHHRYAVYD